VHPGGDRRRRPVARLSRLETEALLADGAIMRAGAGFVLTPAGGLRTLRDETKDMRAQHGALIERTVIDPETGSLRQARGAAAAAGIDRLRRLAGPEAGRFFSTAELRAAERLRQDWDLAQRGLLRGVDWSAPPRGSSPRGTPGEGLPAAILDARARVEASLKKLGAPAATLVRAVVIEDALLETVERGRGWPARSAKVALKMALAQLARG
jgi:hypothetical protein